ncbi:hypothetical protein AX16_010817 [Volvariella volvacea WC 439]|nr:hypothetical protein AX16_010817 [Volvariella volvacea WC 439]
MNQYINNPEAVATAVTQIHDWIRESPANRDQILNHFAVLHVQRDPLCITAFTLLTSLEIMDNLRGGSSNLSRAVESMHQAVQYLNQAAEDNLATMTLLTYPLARSGIHINNDRLVCPLHDQPHLPAIGPRPDPPQLPPPPSSLPQEVAIATSSVDDNNPATSSGSPPQDPPFTATASAVILVTQTVTTTPDSPPYQPQETPPMSPPTTLRPEITSTIPPQHRTHVPHYHHHTSVNDGIVIPGTNKRTCKSKRMEWTRDPRRNTSRSSTCAFGATVNVYISSTDSESTPTTNDESFVDSDPSLVNDRPRYRPDHPHSLTPSGEPPATYPASTSTTTRLRGGATGRQMNGILALKDYLVHPDFSATAGPEDFEARAAL